MIQGLMKISGELVTKKKFAPFFQPDSVAIIGASSIRGKPGHEVIQNILANGYRGKLYLVNKISIRSSAKRLPP